MNVATKLVDGIQWLVVGTLMYAPETTFVSEEETEKRNAACKACPEYKENKCSQCGCFIEQKTRVDNIPFFGKSECPLKNW